MDQRREFVRLAMQDGVNRRELCRRFAIHPDTGYKWLARSATGESLADRSRRPHASPDRTEAVVEAAVLAVRDAHPAWGARKIVAFLKRDGIAPPAVSTVHEILSRHGRIVPGPGGERARLRFEKEAPNLLWQMDFKGWIKLANARRCHPLTVLDDHSRYALGVDACADEQATTVQNRLERVFGRYGLPNAIFVDNGSPWGDANGRRWTRFGVWLLKLGVEVIHSRPYHPQSRGKNERFHRSLKAEVLALRPLRDLADAQKAFDHWRLIYNLDRPHEALGQNVPASRYQPSTRAMPQRPPKVEYDASDIVRRVSTTKAYVSFRGQQWKVPRAFCGERLAIRPRGEDGHYGVFFASYQIANIDLTRPKTVGHVSEQVSTMSPD
jgi:transposase InsO family protein